MHVMRRLKSFASGRTPSVPDTPGDTGPKGINVEQDVGKVTDEPAKVEEKSSGAEQHTISSHINSDARTSSMGGQPGGKKLGVDQLPKEVHEMSIRDCKADNHNDKDTETMNIKGNGAEAGQIITTKIGGRNSQPKQLPKEMHEMSIRDSKTDNHNDKDTETTTIKGNGTEAGQIIITKIGGRNGQPKQTVSYMSERVVGTGSFGVVFQAKCLETEEAVAIKKVFQDKRYKNRELQIMQILDHPNVVLLKHYFFSTTERDELFLNLVLEYVPETVYRMAKQYLRMNQHLPLIYVRLYTYQICRALAYIHDVVGVCHRDIKPQNLLVNPQTHQVKLCDFGSAKKLVPGEPSISYICSRYYRAPELIFGATEYTSAIDMWSVGCVLAELLLGQPLFPGDSGVDQLVEIIKVLGTPTREEIKCMNPNYTEFKFPQIKARPWHKLFHKRLPPEAVDFVTRLLQYSPNLRCTALEACAHPFFDELRDPNTQLPNGRPFPPLFDFTPEELRDAPPELVQRLVPRNIPK